MHSKLASLSHLHCYKPTPTIRGLKLPSADTHTEPDADYCTDKKENIVFLINREIQSGAVAKSYMTNALLICGEIFSHFLIY